MLMTAKRGDRLLRESTMQVGKYQTMAVAIATKGRPQILAETLSDLKYQSRIPDRIVVAYTCMSDIENAPQQFPHVEFIKSPPGLTVQRNVLLETLRNVSFVAFLDDDFYLHRDYLHHTEAHFLNNPKTVATTGRLLRDGINGSGLFPNDAQSMLREYREKDRPLKAREVFNAYGCNMCFRLDVIRMHNIRFDEQLPLYGWYEDVDFSRRVGAHGRIVRLGNALGVHLGVKSGRQSGRKLGYSQVANPIYLAQKSSVPWRFAVASLFSRFMKNLIRSASPESYVDRRGRLAGNVIALRDLASGRLSPMRAGEL